MTASGFRPAPSAFKRVFIALTLPALLTACPSADSVFSSSLSGVATNGHLSGATVTCEANKSTTTTDENGAFRFPLGCGSIITVSGGINVDTGEEFLGELQAPAGATGHARSCAPAFLEPSSSGSQHVGARRGGHGCASRGCTRVFQRCRVSPRLSMPTRTHTRVLQPLLQVPRPRPWRPRRRRQPPLKR